MFFCEKMLRLVPWANFSTSRHYLLLLGSYLLVLTSCRREQFFIFIQQRFSWIFYQNEILQRSVYWLRDVRFHLIGTCNSISTQSLVVFQFLKSIISSCIKIIQLFHKETRNYCDEKLPMQKGKFFCRNDLYKAYFYILESLSYLDNTKRLLFGQMPDAVWLFERKINLHFFFSIPASTIPN